MSSTAESTTAAQASSSSQPRSTTASNTSVSASGVAGGPRPGPGPGPTQQQQPLQQTLPSEETQRHVAEARRAVVATMENMLDSELQWRASTLHANAGVLTKQALEIQRATDGLRKEREKLEREADAAVRGLKELGNVQNWAEVLESEFLVLEETMRLVNGGTDDEASSDDGGGDGGGGSCSCSDCGRGSVYGDEGGDNRMDLDDDGDDDVKGKGKMIERDDCRKDTGADAMPVKV